MNSVPLPPIPSASRRDVPKPPKHLDSTEKVLWRKLVSAFNFFDPASYSLLEVAMSAHARMRHARAQIAIEGEIVEDRSARSECTRHAWSRRTLKDRLHRGDACLELRPWNWESR